MRTDGAFIEARAVTTTRCRYILFDPSYLDPKNSDVCIYPFENIADGIDLNFVTKVY